MHGLSVVSATRLTLCSFLTRGSVPCSMIVIQISNVVATATLTGERQHTAVTCIPWVFEELVQRPGTQVANACVFTRKMLVS